MADFSYIREADRQAKTLMLNQNITKAPIPVQQIAINLGLDVIGYDLGDGVSGTLVIKNGKGYIGYNPSHSKKRQRFTIAHEICHFIMHNDSGKDNLFVDKDFLVKYRGNTSYSAAEMIQEQQANAFAAALLMPEDFVRAELVKLATLSEGELIDALAKVFDVSIPAMTYRLVNLNFL